jgi:hypothetical protein
MMRIRTAGTLAGAIAAVAGLLLLISEVIGVAPWTVIGAAPWTVIDVAPWVVIGVTPSTSPAHDTTRARETTVAPTRPAATKPGRSPEAIADAVSRILDRPLFSPTRRADPPSVAAEILPRLSGILSGPDGSYAIFQYGKASKSQVVAAGAALGAWTVQSILAAGVIVTRGDQRLLLHPAFADLAAANLDVSVPPAPTPIANRIRDEWGRHYQPHSYLERRS